MIAHTPGPWEAVGQYVRTARRPEDMAGFMVADVGVTMADRASNAALIAAAPDLLVALRLLLADQGEHSIGCKEFAPGYDDSKCCPVHIARAAIAKAERLP